VKPALLVAILAIGAPFIIAQESDRARTEALAARAAERLRVLHEEADRLASEERTLLGDLRKLELERQIKEEEFRRLDRDAQAAGEELTSVDLEARRLEEEDEAERPALRSRLTELYKLGAARYLRLVLSLSDARRIVQATRMVAVVAKRDRDRIEAHQERLQELAESKVKLEEQGRQLEALRTEVVKARAALDRAVGDRNALVKDIDERRDLNARLAGELTQAQQNLQTRLKARPGAAAEPAAALPLRPFKGDLPWPVAGVVRQRFGPAAGSAQFSNGIEITANEGTPVTAVHDGTVAFADTFSGFGKLVIVDHGGQTFTVYGNLLDISVTSGGRVDTGQPIGSVGQSVMGTPGLHFELRFEGRPVDPIEWLRRR
jgi:septal ring factor EnvC (AmiA/AmiB activator)